MGRTNSGGVKPRFARLGNVGYTFALGSAFAAAPTLLTPPAVAWSVENLRKARGCQPLGKNRLGRRRRFLKCRPCRHFLLLLLIPLLLFSSRTILSFPRLLTLFHSSCSVGNSSFQYGGQRQEVPRHARHHAADVHRHPCWHGLLALRLRPGRHRRSLDADVLQ